MFDELFPETPWHLVFASREDSEEGFRALEQLFTLYQRPLYKYLLASGYAEDEAKDILQDFNEKMLKGQMFDKASHEGKLRCLLLVSLKNLLINRFRDNTTQKKGRGQILSLDHEHCSEALAVALQPDSYFDVEWALERVARSHLRLREFYQDKEDRLELLNRVGHFLLEDWKIEPGVLNDVADEIGVSYETVKSWFRRMRERFRAFLREEVANTMMPGEDLDEELRYLIHLLTNEQ